MIARQKDTGFGWKLEDFEDFEKNLKNRNKNKNIFRANPYVIFKT
jgi:hypothetical protein